MKKRSVLAGIVMAMILTGCGKSEHDKLTDYYEDQGMSREDAEVAASITESMGATASDMEAADAAAESEKSEEQKRGDEFVLVEPREEIVNSDVTDMFI